MKKWSVLLVAAVLMSTNLMAMMPAPVDIAGTSFENEAIGNKYVDGLNVPPSDHDLINNAGQSHVDSTISSTTAGDLGFDASFVNTRNDGMADGANVGVTNTPGPSSFFVDGSQGYMMGDSDGKMVLTFASVDLSNHINKQFSMQVYVADVGWESEDFLRITLALTGADNITLLDSTGSDIDYLRINDEYLTGAWQLLTTNISDAATSAMLIVEMDSNGNTETMYLDDIRFTGIVPEPASMTIMAIGALAVLRRKTAR